MSDECIERVTTNWGDGHRGVGVGKLKSHFFRLWSKCLGEAAYRHANKTVEIKRLNSSLQLHLGYAWGRPVVCLPQEA